MDIAVFNVQTEVQDEDCLYLNIWSPGLDNARRPVMLWIHGGGFQRGSGSQPEMDGSKLAKCGDVVIVTINYRLTVFGFLRSQVVACWNSLIFFPYKSRKL